MMSSVTNNSINNVIKIKRFHSECKNFKMITHFYTNYVAEKTRFYVETFHTSIGFEFLSEGDECDFGQLT